MSDIDHDLLLEMLQIIHDKHFVFQVTPQLTSKFNYNPAMDIDNVFNEVPFKWFLTKEFHEVLNGDLERIYAGRDTMHNFFRFISTDFIEDLSNGYFKGLKSREEDSLKSKLLASNACVFYSEEQYPGIENLRELENLNFHIDHSFSLAFTNYATWTNKSNILNMFSNLIDARKMLENKYSDTVYVKDDFFCKAENFIKKFTSEVVNPNLKTTARHEKICFQNHLPYETTHISDKRLATAESNDCMESILMKDYHLGLKHPLLCVKWYLAEPLKREKENTRAVIEKWLRTHANLEMKNMKHISVFTPGRIPNIGYSFAGKYEFNGAKDKDEQFTFYDNEHTTASTLFLTLPLRNGIFKEDAAWTYLPTM